LYIVATRDLSAYIYADYSQICLSSAASGTALSARRIIDCITDSDTWLSLNRLQLNPKKFSG
jgi:hypothetical protein